MKPVVRNLKNNDPYMFLGGNKFINLRTGVQGEVPDEKAKEVFRFNPTLSQIIHEYPIVETLISKLNLRFEK